MVSKGASDEQLKAWETLVCPRCKGHASDEEWVVVFRRIRGYDHRLPALRVLKHRPCKELVYFPVKE